MFVQVAVGGVVDQEVEAQLGLPAVPEAAQRAVSRQVVEQPVELKVRVDAGRLDRDRRAISVLPNPFGAPDLTGYELISTQLRLRFSLV